ncbi:hypothetical protein PN499_22900 [Kamptonema animale CS-326]|nr:hypothetical protein [Kamptonema animale]MDB9514052.1 hypothetical protein [Kamptonema animale CS-326]
MIVDFTGEDRITLADDNTFGNLTQTVNVGFGLGAIASAAKES